MLEYRKASGVMNASNISRALNKGAWNTVQEEETLSEKSERFNNLVNKVEERFEKMEVRFG